MENNSKLNILKHLASILDCIIIISLNIDPQYNDFFTITEYEEI